MIAMQNYKALKDKYAHLEFSILPLSKALKDNQTKRLDSEYFKKEYLENEEAVKKSDYLKLKDLCCFICNGDDCREYTQIGKKYIRTGDIKDFGLDLDNAEVINLNFISKTILEIDDVLITRKGNYGKSQVINNDKIVNSIISSEIFQLKLKNINPYFVDIFLKSSYGQLQFEKHIHGVSNFSITQEALLSFLIPIFDSSFQAEIEKIVKDSHHKLEQSKALYKEAESLLYESLDLANSPLTQDTRIFSNTNGAESLESSLRGQRPKQSTNANNLTESRRSERAESHIESFTKSAESTKDSNNIDCHDLTSSSLAMTARDTSTDSAQSTLQNNTPQNFKARFSHLNISIKPLSKSLRKSGRLDSEYYQAKYENIEALIKSYKGGFCHLNINEIKDTNFNPKAEEKYHYIELANIADFGNINEPLLDLGKNLPTRARRKVKTGDFIMSSIEGSLGSCATITPEFDNYLVSTGFYVINTDKINSETLLILFKSAFFQDYLRKFPSGTILTAISKDELQNILIPLLDSQTQEQIASKLKLSFALKKEAKELLDLAKSKVERAIESR